METWLIFFTAVILLGILSQWLAWRIKLPSILPLLLLGFIAGQFVADNIALQEDILFAIVSLSVAVIMLEGGLTLKVSELNDSGKPLLLLCTVGAAVTWVLSTLALHFLGDFGWRVSLLIGAILVVTGPTVIGPLLRNVRPQRNLNSILKWEGIVIDPIGAILAVLVFGALFGHGDHGHGHDEQAAPLWLSVLKNLGIILIIGLGLGYTAAKGLLFVLRRHWIPDYLQSVVILAIGLGLFTLSNLLSHESGLLTVTILGIVLANQEKTPVRHIVEFKENLRVILISCLFIVLGGRIAWQEVVSVWKESLMILAALILVIRPLSVYISCWKTKLTFKEKAFLSLMAPRGIVAAAVSAIFALALAQQGEAYALEAKRIVPVIFSIIFGTVTFYGLLAAPIARRLGIATPNPQGLLIAGASPWTIKVGLALQEAGYRMLILDSNYNLTREARMKGLQVVTANAMSDYAIESVDLSGIGRLLAVTPNDQVNSLACIGFGHALGRSNTYQLEPADKGEDHKKSSSFELSGRHLFEAGVTAEVLSRFHRDSTRVTQTLITEEFSYQDFRDKNGDDVIPLFIARKNGNLSIVSTTTSNPVDGDTVFSLSNAEKIEAS